MSNDPIRDLVNQKQGKIRRATTRITQGAGNPSSDAFDAEIRALAARDGDDWPGREPKTHPGQLR